MFAATDLVGLGSLIAATCAGIVSIIVALRQNAIAPKVEDIHNATQGSNGHTLVELVEQNAARNDTQDDAAGVPRTP